MSVRIVSRVSGGARTCGRGGPDLDRGCGLTPALPPETPRLRLRPHTPADLDALAAMWADPRVVATLGGRPFTREESWARLLRYVGHQLVYGWSFWAVEDRVSGEYLGNAGVMNFERDLVLPLTAPEMGWGYRAETWGKGIATEAAHAIAAFADAQGWPATQAIIAPDNAASRAVAARVGFAHIRDAMFKSAQTGIFERPAHTSAPPA